MEKYLFESQYLVTKERMIKTGKILAKKTKSLPIWLRVLSEIIIGILAIIYVYLAIIDKDIIITIYAILLSLSFIYNVKNMIFGSRQYRKLLADAKETDTIKKFGEDHIEVEYADSTRKFFYDNIHYFEEDKDNFYLWEGTETMIIVDKNTFTVGKEEDFYIFIRDKIGGASKEIWTKKEFDKKMIKNSLPTNIRYAAFTCMLPLIVAISLIKLLFFGEVNWTVGGGYEVITSLDIDGGAIVFYTDEINWVAVSLFEETRPKDFSKINGHSYSIGEVNEYNKKSDLLFESPEGLLIFNGYPTIVYGIAELDWWEESVNKPIQQQYTVIEFECIDEDYVLYYRNVGDKLGLI